MDYILREPSADEYEKWIELSMQLQADDQAFAKGTTPSEEIASVRSGLPTFQIGRAHV